MKKNKNSKIEGKPQIKGGVKSKPLLLKELKKAWKVIFKFYTIFLMVGMIMGNFMIFLVIGYAWMKSQSKMLELMMYVAGGNIIMFTISTYTQINRRKLI